MEYIREHKRGIIGTAIFHTAVLLLLIFLGFFTQLPLPGEEGIFVNFGTSENGLGDFEPSPANSEAAPVQPVEQKQEEEVPPTPAVTSPPKPQPKPAAAKEVAITQDYEKTAAINAAEEKKQKDLLDEQRREQTREAERIKNAEAEKIRKAEAEKAAKAEADRKAKEEEQRKINEISSRAQGAFASTGEGKSQGATFPGGNQGVTTGDPNSNISGQGGSGNGSKGAGPSFNLAGRRASSLPKPEYPGDESGVVVVKITVDKSGKVTTAVPGDRGTNIINRKFWEEAKKAALKSTFYRDDDNAAAYQQGTITYRFVIK